MWDVLNTFIHWFNFIKSVWSKISRVEKVKVLWKNKTKMQIKKKRNRFGSSIRNVSASCSHYYWIEWLAIILGAAMCLFYIIFDVNLHISFIFVSFAFCSIGKMVFQFSFALTTHSLDAVQQAQTIYYNSIRCFMIFITTTTVLNWTGFILLLVLCLLLLFIWQK